ncbi:hypothetical protein DL546_006053 [Coniochaeta pulveracea]|uniref:Dehydrogenase FUB6 n=1 Tax=Coniochaeta pulveracea TaxID=177199 RepID=A0A420Y3X1_9PEZI|nr:hypothetical protein DL546_006053 [Coniochaeta pulveracea]
MAESLSVHLAKRPEANVVPGETFSQKTSPAPTPSDLKDGQLLVETLYLSLDPAMRGWLRDERSYLPPVQIGEVMRGGSVCRVLASKSSNFKAGDLVTTFTAGWREIAIVKESDANKVVLPPNGHVTDALGVLGMTGLTAYFGMMTVGQPKKGETVVVTAAAGATGSVAAQIAKILGARVVGIAGGEEKRKWLEEVGFDVALDYKDPDFRKKFKEATPGFIDVFWDNVGGEQLDMGLARANKFARFVMCGAISQYNNPNPQGPRNISKIITMRIRMEGFIVLDHVQKFPEAVKQLGQWLAEGKLQRKETIVKGGLKVAEEALLQLFEGKNTGKLLVEVKNPGESSKL